MSSPTKKMGVFPKRTKLLGLQKQLIQQCAKDAAAANKRMSAFVSVFEASDPRILESLQVYMHEYGAAFGVSAERADAMFAQIQDAVHEELQRGKTDS